MITLMIKSYLTIFLSVGLSSLFVFIVGLYLILRKPVPVTRPITSTPVRAKVKTKTAVIDDVSLIAGDDIVATQLDLARAYIETNNKLLAKKILEYVTEQGSAMQQTDAQRLLNTL